MADRKPFVSIGLPVYNGRKYIRRALDSLIAQDYENFELIISDNASDDSTREILQAHSDRHKRIRLYLQSKNTGSAENFRFVLAQAKGEYFMWAACDDYWYPSFINAMVHELETHPEAGVSMCAVERFKEDGAFHDNVIFQGRENPSRLGHFGLAMALGAGKPYHLYIYGLYRREFLKKAFKRFPRVVAGDRLFICQIALATKFCYVSQFLHRRQINTMPLSERYSSEDIGRLWQDPLGRIKMILHAGSYLFHSEVIPWHRKFYIPLVLIRLAIWNSYFILIDVIKITTIKILGTKKGKHLLQVMRRALGKYLL